MFKYLLLYLSLYSFQSYSQTGSVYGKVENSQKEGLPYTNIVIQGTAQGTTSNLDGFYQLTLPVGEYKLSFQYIGYASESLDIVIKAGKKIIIDVILEDEKLQLNEVVVKANAEDPAYEIIRQAQKKRKFHLNENKNYTVDIYTKLYGQSGSDLPGKISFFGTELEYKKGVFYFSETIYKNQVDNSGKQTEELIASIVHEGDSNNISENISLFINLYDRWSFAISMGGNTGRLKSPISEEAFLYYKFKWEGSYEEQDRIINKIYVEPKSVLADLYTGHIYIIENEWRILKANLAINGLFASILGDITIATQYGFLEESDKWVPLLTNFKLEKIDSTGKNEDVQIYHINTFKDFDFSKEEIPKNNISRLANRNAIINDTSFWNAARPIRLTKEEARSINNSAKDSEKFNGFEIDSSLNLNAKEKSKFDKFLKTSYLVLGNPKHEISKNYSIQKNHVLDFLSFNTIEGWVLKPTIELKGKTKNLNKISFSQTFRYGFASQTFYHRSEFDYEINPKKLSSINIQGGDYVAQISGEEVGRGFYNSLYSLFRQENFLKIYNRKYIAATYQQEIFNGIEIAVGGSYNVRNPLDNNTSYSWAKAERPAYTPNVVIVNGEPLDFASNTLLNFDVRLKIHFARKYNLINDRKEVLANKYPVLTLGLDQGLLDVNYLKGFANVRYKLEIGLLGESNFSATHGRFLNHDKVTVLDYFHFNANQYIFTNKDRSLGLMYQLMPFYNFSTPSNFTGLNYSHYFNGAVFKRLPLLKHTGIQSIIHFNYLNTAEQGDYFEMGVGLAHRILPFRVDYYWSYLGNQFLANGLRVNYYIGKK